MEDFITFLVIIAAIVINLMRLRKGNSPPGQRPAEPPGEQPSPRRSASVEDFFDQLSRKFEPQPRDVPAWPDDIERPDYLREMEEYEEEPEPPVPQKPVVIPPVPVAEQPRAEVAPIQDQVMKVKALAKSSAGRIKSNNVSMAGISGSRIAVPPLLRSAAGQTHFEISNRRQLKQALLAHMVFGPPRAYEQSFHNTLAE